MDAARKKLGEILIDQKILTPLIVKRVIKISNSTHRRFGQTLEDLGLLTGEEIAQALSVQYGYKIVRDICRYTIGDDVLRLVPMELAFNNRIFPLQMKEGALALAMADPTNDQVIATVVERLHLRVVPFIATTDDIMKAIAKNYLRQEMETRPNTVLLVDSDGRERTRLASCLSGERYDVLQALDAKDGFRQALLHSPKLIITAKDMPKMDGFAFFSELQNVAETRRIPVILLSERPSAEEEAIAFQRGFFDYIAKPVRDITLVTRVSRAFAAGRSYVPHRPGAISLDFD